MRLKHIAVSMITASYPNYLCFGKCTDWSNAGLLHSQKLTPQYSHTYIIIYIGGMCTHISNAMARALALPAVPFRIPPLGAGFSEKIHVSPLSILGHYFDVVSLGKALHSQMLHLAQVKMSTWYDRDGDMYDKSNARKWLQDCYTQLSVSVTVTH